MLSFLAAAVWTVDAVLQLASPSDPQMRPDGTAFAYVYRGSIYSQELNAANTAVRIGAGSRPRWSPDSRQLALIRDGQVYVGDRLVTPASAAISSFAWSSDGRHIACIATDASKPADPILAGQDLVYSRLYLQAVSGGDSKLVSKKDRHVVSFALSPDGTRAAYAAQPSPANRDSFTVDLYEVDLRSGAERELVVQPGRDSDPHYSLDGRFVGFHSQAGSRNYFEARHVGVVPSGGGTIRYVTRNHPFDAFGRHDITLEVF